MAKLTDLLPLMGLRADEPAVSPNTPGVHRRHQHCKQREPELCESEICARFSERAAGV